ncbi:MAG: hypothetical protein GDA44_08985 [Prochloron sp. SP5CPC1]|nr:hypothetical protein [Candidatus Paraprochloron terpiosi SP5CPC1]
MRNISKWGEELRKKIREDSDFKKYTQENDKSLKGLAQLITEVELGLTLLQKVAPKEPATAVSALLSGHRFPVESMKNEENWQLIQRARFYLLRRKGREWERSLKEYIKVPERLRVFQLNQVDDVPQQIRTSVYSQRDKLYEETLKTTPPHNKEKVKRVSEPGMWYAQIKTKGESSVEIPLSIPQEALTNVSSSPLVTFQSTRRERNPSSTVTFQELLKSAQEMDAKLEEKEEKAENYHQRLSRVALHLYQEEGEDFQPGTELKIEQLVHIVGLLNVGKSTLLQVLIYHLAKQELRCGLIVNDVVESVRLASLFSHKLGIPAAPILGQNRPEQLAKVAQPILAGSGEKDTITEGGTHPAYRWFSTVCPLLGLSQAEKWEFGEEPCHSLYQKKEQKSPQNRKKQEREDTDSEYDRKRDNSTCPFYYNCPRHQLEQDIGKSMVWILTPASLIHTHVPKQLFSERIRFAEAVYRECNFLFVDEADRVQVQLDEDFAPSETLLDNTPKGLLNRLAQSLIPIYNGSRLSMRKDLYRNWCRDQRFAQNAIDSIIPLLYDERVHLWLGEYTFTGRSLFSRMVGELLPNDLQEGNKDEERKQREEFLATQDSFFRNPLNNKVGGELAQVALTITNNDNIPEQRQEIQVWWEQWLKDKQIPLPEEEDKLKELLVRTHFAILITILNNKLGFLVDYLNVVQGVGEIDLKNLNPSLVNRPPKDYLPVVPDSPVGNILGFKYSKNQDNSWKLDYFRYVGIGRYLLLHFPQLFAADGRNGPHTVLISGTSYVPGSPAYHLTPKPTVLLKPTETKDKGIKDSQLAFTPQMNDKDNYITVSGLPFNKRQTANEEMVAAICKKSGRAPSYLNGIFEELQEKEKENGEIWGDRQRLLLITNSYDEAEWVQSRLKEHYKDKQYIARLIRDHEKEEEGCIPRGDIRNLKNIPYKNEEKYKIVVAPLMALERGHNILKNNNKAAFGAALFLCRPMPVPGTWDSTVQQLNHWALENIQKISPNSTLTEAEKTFYNEAVKKMRQLNSRANSFRQFSSEERKVLCWTELVSIWQIIGRLVRSGVPCLVRFLDSSFAPNFAQNKPDTATTSLLVGIIDELQSSIEEKDLRPYQETLAKSLYGDFYHALKNTERLNHGL